MRTLFILFAGLALVLNSCGFKKEADSAEKYAEQFYQHMQNDNMPAIEKMLDAAALSASPADQWKEVIQRKNDFGKLESYKKDIGFHTSINNGVTMVSLRYTCKYTNLTFYEKLVLVKRGNEFKVYSYEYNQDKNQLSED